MNFRNHFNPDYDEAKVLILKAKQSVILYLAATVSVAVVSIGKSVGRQRYDDVNFGSGRIWMITGKTLMPAITFLAFPVLDISATIFEGNGILSQSNQTNLTIELT